MQPAVDALLSVDSRSAAVAQAAVEAGADIVNDVSAGANDADMLPVVGRLGVPYIAMHMRSDPSTMTQPRLRDYTRPMLRELDELPAGSSGLVAASAEAGGTSSCGRYLKWT